MRKMVRSSARSPTRYSVTRRQSTLRSTKNGSIHSVYCGEWTLWNSMNPASMAALTPIHGKTLPRCQCLSPSHTATPSETMISSGEATPTIEL